jgi:hypothetical protein
MDRQAVDVGGCRYIEGGSQVRLLMPKKVAEVLIWRFGVVSSWQQMIKRESVRRAHKLSIY